MERESPASRLRDWRAMIMSIYDQAEKNNSRRRTRPRCSRSVSLPDVKASWPALVLSLLLDRCGNQTGATKGAGGGLYLVVAAGVAKARP